MASEVLAVPEENLAEVILVIRAGLKAAKGVSRETRGNLGEWCRSMEEYLTEITDGE